MTMLNNSSISLVLRSKLWILNLLEHPNHTSTSMRLIPRAPPFGDEDGCAPIRRSKWRLCKMHDIFQSEGIFVPRLLKESDMKSWNTMKYHRIKELQQQVMSRINKKNAFTMASSSQTFSCNPFAEELSLLGGNNLSLSQSHSKLESLKHCH